MKQTPLFLPLSITLFFLLFSSSLFPSLKLSPLSIFLAFCYHRYPLETCLWIATGCGLAIDLFSADQRVGTHALALGLTTLILYRYKVHFFEEKMLALSLFAMPISLLWTCLQWLLVPLSGIPFSFSFSLVITDLVFMPISDALYAFFLFCCPLVFYRDVKKMGFKPCIANYLSRMEQKWPRLTRFLPKSLQASEPG